MLKRMFFARPMAAVTAVGFLATGMASPALAVADTVMKPHTVRLPVSARKDDASKLCVPRQMLDKARRANAPRNVCHTQSDWAAQGVTIVFEEPR